jgi:hypothetical protein
MPDGGDASKNPSRDGILQRAAMATALVRACACVHNVGSVGQVDRLHDMAVHAQSSSECEPAVLSPFQRFMDVMHVCAQI